MLTQLKNGNWRNLCRVDGLQVDTVLVNEVGFVPIIRVLFYYEGPPEELRFNTDAEAQYYRDELASQVNEAKKKYGARNRPRSSER